MKRSRSAKAKACNLTTALSKLAGHERYLAYEVQGRRYDMGLKYGLLTAQLALALDGEDRDEVLTRPRGTARREGREMSSRLMQIITATDPPVRNQSLDAVCRGASLEHLLAECAELDAFRRAERESLRTSAGAFLPLRHSSLSYAAQCRSRTGAG